MENQENKISQEQLEELQGLVGKLNQAASQIGNLELQKHQLNHAAAEVQQDLNKLQAKLEEKYGKIKIDIQLKPSSENLEEVVVVGYGTSRVKELTGATVQVKGESIERLNIPRMDQALQGQVSGVTISTNSGSPGGTSNIRIRGLSTSGNNNPLILVDGVVYDAQGLNALNPGDIESINVLKDATAGIYGVRAANGVIIIETKKGKKGSKSLLFHRIET